MFLGINWIDLIIITVVFFYILDGWQTGLVFLVSNLITFLGALWLAIKYHAVAGNFLVTKFGLPLLWTNVLGYLIVAVVSDVLLSEIFSLFLIRLPKRLISSKINQWLGAILSACNSFIIISFFLLLILALPLRGSIKKDIRDSKIGSVLVLYAEKYGGSVKSSLDEVTRQAIKFLTVEPQSNESISLDISPKASDLVIDENSEKEMLQLVNSERAKAGVGALRLDPAIVTVARKHSFDMFERRYFSHIDPDGHDPAYRMEEGNVNFTVVGENIAYAPDVATAHQGLMNSPGHRRNILDPQFHRIGIGIVDAGTFGEMFTQEFAD